MAKTVVIDVDINTNVEETGEKFVKLQTRIKEVKKALQEAAEAGDQTKFSALKEDLDVLNDQLEKTTLQSKKFEDALASVPGPAGMVGKAVQGLDGAFKFLAANPVVGVIAGLGAIFMGIYKALTKTAEGQAALSKVTDAFGRILTPIINFISSMAVPIVEGFAFVLDKLGEAFAFVTGKSDEYNASISNDAAIKKAEANAKKQGELIESEGFMMDEFTKRKADANLKYEQKRAALLARTDLDDKERNRRLELARLENNQAIDAADADRAKKASDFRKQQYNESVNQAKANAAAIKALTEEDRRRFEQMTADYQKWMDDYYARRKQLMGVEILTQKQLREWDQQDAEEKAKKKKEEDDKRVATQMDTMSKITNFTLKAIQTQQTAQKKAAEDTDKIGKWLNSEEKKRLDEKVLAVAATLRIVSSLVDEQSVAGKAIAVALTTIDTYQSATAAYKSVVGIPVVGPTLAPIAAAAAIAAGLLSVKKIISTPIPKADGKGTVGSGGGSAGAASFSNVASIPAPVIAASEASSQGNLGNIIAGSINDNNSTSRPIQAYVVAGQVNTQQQLDRRISTAARLGG